MIVLELLVRITKKAHQVLNGFIQYYKQTKYKAQITHFCFIQAIKMEEFLHLDPNNGSSHKDGLSLKTFLYLMLQLKLVLRIWEAFKSMILTSYLWQ